MKIGFAITSSYCTIETVLDAINAFVQKGYEVIPIVSPGVIENDTRFGKGSDFKKILEDITGHNIVSTIIEAEKFGSIEPLDLMIVAPATGNFVAKLAHAITDTPVTMAAKATMRNHKPVVIGISSNDGLGLNGENVMRLLNQKDVYFIPFGQDDYEKKPNSLIAHYDLSVETVEAALENRQLQPVLRPHVKKKQ